MAYKTNNRGIMFKPRRLPMSRAPLASAAGRGVGGSRSGSSFLSSYTPPPMPPLPIAPPINPEAQAATDLRVSDQPYFDQIKRQQGVTNDVYNNFQNVVQGLNPTYLAASHDVANMLGQTLGSFAGQAPTGGLPAENTAQQGTTGALGVGAALNQASQAQRGVDYNASVARQGGLDQISRINDLAQQAADFAATEPDRMKQLIAQYMQMGFDNQMAIFKAAADWAAFKAQAQSQGQSDWLAQKQFGLQRKQFNSWNDIYQQLANLEAQRRNKKTISAKAPAPLGFQRRKGGAGSSTMPPPAGGLPPIDWNAILSGASFAGGF